MRIHLGGHLNWYDAEKRAWLTRSQPTPIAVSDLAAELGLPLSEVAIVAVNGRMADWDGPPVTDADVVEFYSPLGGG
jgi:sulfur carrier protein ThiS